MRAKKHGNEKILPRAILRNCRAVVFDRVVSEKCGDAVLEKGCWRGKFVADSKLTISKRQCFLIRLDGEKYAQIYLNFNDPKIKKTKWYCVSESHEIDPDHYHDTKSVAVNKCTGVDVVKGEEILEHPEDYHVVIVFY